ncbi:phosphoribosylanthranilate isomerase [Natronolimnohabitans innermongolicus]|nr:phosphoribosylanthranilate isomerase [Natronolimnohabitans innermongolicus]
MTRVKVCGLTREDDLEAAVDAGADAVGIICDVPVETPREVSIDRARELAASVPPFVTSVLVTMGEDPTKVSDLEERVEPDAIQHHGTPAVDEVAELHASIDAQFLLAVGADDVPELELAAYDELVDGVLVDTPAADGGGGTGETHDWDRTRDVAAELESPLILAGGLTPENVANAVRTVDPFAVDVASGVEASGGVKDHDAVSAFVDRAKAAQRTADHETPVNL